MVPKYLFICMKWGQRYPADYVNRMHAMIERNIGGEAFQLVCFTEDATGVRAGVDIRPLPPFEPVPEWMRWKPWRKLSLMNGDLPADLVGRDALFIDLDVVITGDLRPFFTFHPGKYCVIENWTKAGQNIGNTSVFRYNIGKYPEIFTRFMANPEGARANGVTNEQEFISATLHPRGEQHFWPAAWCRSFKESLLPIWPLRLWQPARLPDDCRIAVFHGKPDPDEARDGKWPAPWYQKFYKTTQPTHWIAEYWRE